MVQERVEVPAEGVAALGEGPVRRAHGLEAPGEALGQAALHEKRRRTEKYHADVARGPRVGVPLGLHLLGPARRLLHLVEDQDGRLTLLPGGAPLLGDPLGAERHGAVGARVHERQTKLVDGLTHAGRLPALPGAEDDLHGPAPLAQARDEDVGGVAPIHRSTLQIIAQRSEYYRSAYRAKQRLPESILRALREEPV